MKKLTTTRIALVLLLGATVAAFSCAGAGPTPASGGQTTAPPSGTGGGSITDFSLEEVGGGQVALSDYLGRKVILISFWATWCEPCKKEMVQLQALFDAHADAGLQIISISMDEPETQGDARTYVKQRGYTFPVLLDTETTVTNRLNPRRAAPFTLIISKDQKIVWEHESYVPGDEKKIEEAVLAALAQAAS